LTEKCAELEVTVKLYC